MCRNDARELIRLHNNNPYILLTSELANFLMPSQTYVFSWRFSIFPAIKQFEILIPTRSLRFPWLSTELRDNRKLRISAHAHTQTGKYLFLKLIMPNYIWAQNIFLCWLRTQNV